MKFMDIFYKALGFETDDVKAIKKKNPKKASYNLKVSQKLPDEIDGVKVFYPESLNDCKEKADLLKKETPFILDFRNCSNSDKNKILDYFDGVNDVLESRYEQIEKTLYNFLPKDFEIEIN